MRAAAEHQLAVQKMSPEQLAGHDPTCCLCRIPVSWTAKGWEVLLKSHHSGAAPAAELGDLAPDRDVAPPQDTK